MIDNPIPWPAGARCAVAVTWDMDAESGLAYRHPGSADTLQASLSYLRYGPTIAVPRLVKAFGERGLRQTFFVPGWCIERYPRAVDLLLENGHEVALHGYLHERPNELAADDERRALARALAAYERHAGGRPRGWRAPGFAFSKHSLRYLLEEGFAYDSSLMGDDVPHLIADGAGALVELPTQWDLDDWPHYMHNRDFGYTMPISSPTRAAEVFRAEFDAAWEYGGLWVSVWHPFLSGRPAKLRAALALIDEMRGRGGVWFARMDEICGHVRALMAEGRWTPRVDRILGSEGAPPEPRASR
jgi:peptidoglycan/xylan/chitin deacetylase (PgdA/CDA1 family)